MRSEMEDGFPEKYHVIDLKIGDRLLGAAIAIGGFLFKHIMYEPRPTQSDHYRSPGDSIKASHRKAYNMAIQQAMTFDLVPEVEKLTHQKFTEEQAQALADADADRFGWGVDTHKNRWDESGRYFEE